MKGLFHEVAPAQLGDYGLHVLVDKASEGEGIVDIVAVHGLNGHYKNTWTTARPHGTEVNWLVHVLPNHQLIHARIMAFSYNSSVQFSKSTSDVFVFADQLLEHLIGKLEEEGEQSRPIVFICHSLGGIVVKQALNRAAESSRYRDTILNRVFGIFFFGTPHRGSELAPLGYIASRALKAGSMGSHTNSQLTRDLERNSSSLSQISKSFLQHGHRIKIVSFVETEKMDWLSCLVVDQDSATLGWPGEIIVPIDGNHRNICRFTGERDPRIAPVLSNIQQMFRAIRVDYLSSVKNKPNTANGHFENSFPADAGCGKSVLTSYLINHFQKHSATGINVCYFFFKDDNVEQSDAIVGMSALLYQLYSANQELLDVALKHLGVPGTSLKSVSNLWRIFEDSIRKAAASSTTICLLDGLDECEEKSRKQLLECIERYFMKQLDEKDGQHNLKMLVLSRPDNSIKIRFDRHVPQEKETGSFTGYPSCAIVRLRGEDESEAISKDIELVVKDAMGDLAAGGLPLDLLEDVERDLITRADRTFLWATLIIQLLKDKAIEGASRREMDAILRSRDIYSIYTALLKSKVGAASAAKAKARKMLSLILGAMRTLTVDELNIALAIKPDHDTFAESTSGRRPSSRTFQSVEYKIVYPSENHIKSVCGHFVRIIHHKVYLVHQTAREFLLDEASWKDLETVSSDMKANEELWELSDSDSEKEAFSRASWSDFADGAESMTVTSEIGDGWQHTFSLKSCHALMLEICTAYLYMLAKPCKGAVLGHPTKEVAYLLRYAAGYWVSHFHKVCDSIPPSNLPYYHGLCHPRFPGFTTWLEAHDEQNRTPVFGSGSVEQQQDLLIQKLALEPGQPGFGRDVSARLDLTTIFEAGVSNLQILSCNPSQSQNLVFPVKADETGVVSLDFELAARGGVIGHPDRESRPVLAYGQQQVRKI
ncbi:hypothetical protein J7T55_012326 [Diaporthe amygdali]|uniref:uncharacterized protein n=1 Tax=Phomopsis amygdali TaxID=1214568 RepID=UPI0022FE4E78|nr:uncharacterized protein J7T55_012326 [Diaporthe amygdali]KAJ0123855.1 hypothetical protein J7T55_012326 [Diaporthe amygdali]